MRDEQLTGFSSDRKCCSRVVLRSTWGLRLFLLIFVGGCALFVGASTPQFQKAVVMHVERSQPTLPYRRRLGDSPPPPAEYDFEVSLRVGCLVYVGLYQSAIDYLPGTIAPDQSVEVSVEKHVLRVKVPDREITMGMTRRYRASPGTCNSDR